MAWTSFRFKKTITKYILKELIPPFGLGLLIFTFVLLMERVLDLIEWVINKGVSLKAVLELIVFIMPSFLVLTIPMAVLVATLTAFGRLSTDSEVTAMKASGISLYSMYAPVLLFSLAATALTFFLYTKALPWGNHNFRVAAYELARTKASIGLKEHIFNKTFPGLVIYIDRISDEDERFENIMISDTRDNTNPQVIFAKKGELITDEHALRVTLRLEDGESHPKNVVNPLKYQIVKFPQLDIVLSFQDEDVKSGTNIPRTDRDMTLPQLVNQYGVLKARKAPSRTSNTTQTASTPATRSFLHYIQGIPGLIGDSAFFQNRLASPYLVEIHKRFSIPLACIVFGLIGTPLGIQSRRAGKSGGYAISVALLLIYYIFITAGESLGDDGKLPVLFAVWTPNILLGITGLILLIRMARR